MAMSALRRAAAPPHPLAPLLQQLIRRASGAPAPAAESAGEPRPFSEMPGPTPLPLVGNVWRFLPGGPWSGADFLDLHRKLQADYGPMVRVEGGGNGKDFVFVYDPVAVEKVYRSEGPWPKRDAFQSLAYYRGVLHRDKFEGALGLLNTNDEEWQQFRKKVSQPLLQPRTVANYLRPIDEVASEFVDRLRDLRGADGRLPEDAVNWFYRWALESIATVALDTRLGCLAPGLAPDSEAQRLIDAVQKVFDGSFELDVMPSPWRYISTPAWRRYVKAVDTFDEVSNKYIDAAMQRIRASAGAGAAAVAAASERSVLERLLLSNDNPRVACTMALDMLFAGIDTTSYATGALLYLLSRAPDKQEKLHAELRRVLPDPGAELTAERMADLKYLRACIKESMRMKPVAIGQIRENTSDDLVLANYKIPKGVDVVMMLRIICENEEHFPEPLRFVPERWIKGDELASAAHAFCNLPFGFGPRACVGRRFAEMEIEVLNARLLRNFRVEYPRGEATFATKLLHVMTSPFDFRLVDRD